MMPGDLKDEEQKRLMQAAIDAWLDRKFAEFGRWTAKGIGALLLAGLLLAYVKTGGFKL